jgi:AcrR family transcriptional regulator
MDKRKAAADDTRARIVEAAVGLHAEKGALATTWQDIARRADVAVGTVYHHFPSLDELLPACTGYGMRQHPPPTPEILQGIGNTAERVRRFVAVWFAFYEQTAPWQRWYRDTPDLLPVVRQTLERRMAWRQAQIREALSPKASPEAVRMVMALTEFGVWRSLAAVGLSSEAAAEEISDVLNTWLEKVDGLRIKRRGGSTAARRQRRQIS